VRTLRGDENLIVDASLGADERGIDASFAVNNVAMEGIFYKRFAAG
jgi:hypothetical protein